MDERAALALVEAFVSGAGDDAAVVDETAIAVDMLHTSTDYPPGVSPYTAGWRTVSVALSDIAAVGATPTATLSVYAPPRFDQDELEAYLTGAIDASSAVGASYVGGDLDITDELTTVGIALGDVADPTGRDGARPGDAVVVTGTLGRGALAVDHFEAGDVESGNELFQVTPRVTAGRHLGAVATAMIDSSDGLARSLHLLAEASGCGFDIEEAALPVDPRIDDIAEDAQQYLEYGLFWGEDFELVATVPPTEVSSLATGLDVDLTRIGTVTDNGVTMDGEALPDRGYSHE